jgi:hypothetical protein
MPKGQSPKSRMDARRSRLNAEVDEMSGRNLPRATYSSDDSLPRRAAGAAINALSDARGKQMRRQAGSRLTDAEAQLDKIDTGRENEAQRSGRAQRFAKGGQVKAQVSGKTFKGTF